MTGNCRFAALLALPNEVQQAPVSGRVHSSRAGPVCAESPLHLRLLAPRPPARIIGLAAVRDTLAVTTREPPGPQEQNGDALSTDWADEPSADAAVVARCLGYRDRFGSGVAIT